MSMRNAAFVAFGFATLALACALYFVHRDLTARPQASLADHVGGGGTVGDNRLRLLTKLTRAYVSRNTGAPAAMREGTALAPEGFLNKQLEAQGIKWRVRNVHGLAAETYNVT